MSQPVSVGRVVHFVLGERTIHDGSKALVIRPAIVVAVWGPDTANLQVFTDGSNDNEVLLEEERGAHADRVVWRTSRMRSDEPRVDTWHWPPRSES